MMKPEKGAWTALPAVNMQTIAQTPLALKTGYDAQNRGHLCVSGQGQGLTSILRLDDDGTWKSLSGSYEPLIGWGARPRALGRQARGVPRAQPGRVFNHARRRRGQLHHDWRHDLGPRHEWDAHAPRPLERVRAAVE